MPLVVPLGDEVGEHQLIEMMRLPVGCSPGRAHRIDERGRHDHEPKSKGWEQRLGEGADVQDVGAAVEPLETGDGFDAVPELAVVVVLDDQALVRAAQSSSASRRLSVISTPRGN